MDDTVGVGLAPEVGEGVSGFLGSGLSGSFVGVGVGCAAVVVGVGAGYGVGLLTGSSLPPQATSNTTAVERRSSRMDSIFTKPYYPTRLLNGSAEGTVYWQYVSVPKPGESC